MSNGGNIWVFDYILEIISIFSLGREDARRRKSRADVIVVSVYA